MKKVYLLLVALIALQATCLSQVPTLLKNVDTVTIDPFSSSFPGKGVVLNGYFYFPAEDYNGRELWRTDGTAAGTTFLKDLTSIFDRDNSDPGLLNVVGDSLYFFRGQGYHHFRYSPITNDITDASQGKDQAYTPTETVVMGNFIFFASDWYYGQGVELLRYDVTNNNLAIYNINPDTFSSYPHNLVAKGDTLYFAATDTAHGTELWMYDPNYEDVFLVKDIAPGHDSSNPADLIAYNDNLFFTARDTTFNGYELWKSDGSDVGTYLYADINPDSAGSSTPGNKTVFRNKLYFNADDGTNGNELWMVDDSAVTFEMIADINPSGGSYPGLTGFKQVDTFLYFGADDGGTFDRELWKTDGTMAGTELVKDINQIYLGSDPRDFYNLGDTLIFVANDWVNGWQLWRSNGTAATTSMIQNSVSYGYDTAHISGIFNNKLYFGGHDTVKGTELWKTGGTDASTSLVKDINLGNAISSTPQWFQAFGGYMFFNGKTSSDYWFSLFRTDATTAGTVEIIHGSIADTFSIGPQHPAILGSNMILSCYTPNAGFELWKSDGTAVGTVQIKDIQPGAGEGNPNFFNTVGTNVLFIADDGVNGQELWKTDGTTAGTSLVKDIKPGAAGSDIENVVVANGKLFFKADNGTNGKEVWVSDGTTAGTFMLKDIMPGSANTPLSGLFPLSTGIYFSADDGVNGRELWKSNGTTLGTVMVKDINPGSASSNADWFAELGGWIYFAADSGGASAIWKTDGTAANTHLFYNITFPFLLQNVGSRIVFIADPQTSTNGFHIWSTNGTVAGTMEIEDFLPGTCGYFILDNFITYNGRVFYWIDDNISGQELWASDGTAPGTIKYDIAPGPHSSYPREARGFNPLIFSADDGSINGREPWKLNVPAPLPIQGLEFTAEKKGTTAVLNWKTHSETNNYGFQVQHSSNGTVFDSIGFVYARGGSATGANYDFTDFNPVIGKNYYRLKQVDVSGKAAFSDIRTVEFNSSGVVKAYPNPTADILNISSGHRFNNGRLTVRSMSGQEVLTQNVTGDGTISIPVKNLANGVYNAEVKEGEFSMKFMFLKQ